MGCVIVEGYGLTECVAPACLTVQGDPSPDHVGPPLPCNNIKLEAWVNIVLGTLFPFKYAKPQIKKNTGKLKFVGKGYFKCIVI